jgi:spectinomycin phosphotransferase
MLEKPQIPDGALTACLRRAYGIRAAELAFLPLGADPHTAVYRVVADDGIAYFLKLRHGGLAGASVEVPRLLSDRGFTPVIAPVASAAGRLWTRIAGFTAVFYLFVDGRDWYAVSLSDAQWVELGAAVRGIHALDLPTVLARRIPRDTFSPFWREALRRALARTERERFDDPVAADLATLLRAHRDRITEMVDRADRLAQALRARRLQRVLCHGDLHAGNVLIGEDGAVYIVDWDALVFAPRERDFEQVDGGWGGEHERRCFYEGYGDIQLDQTALAYYRSRRIVEDIVVACRQVLDTREGGANREQELRYVVGALRPEGALDIARTMDCGSPAQPPATTTVSSLAPPGLPTAVP